MLLTWGVEHVEVEGSSLSDNQMTGFSLQIIVESMSFPFLCHRKTTQESKEKKDLKERTTMNLLGL